MEFLSLIYRRFAQYSFWFIKAIGVFFLILIFLWSAIFSSGLIGQQKECVLFPNGVLLGKESWLDANYTLNYYLELKLANGDRLLDEGDYVYRLSFSRSTIYGIAGPRRRLHDGKGGRTYGFAYRADVGFVSERDNFSQYERLKRDAGELISLPAHDFELDAHLTTEHWNMWRVYDLLEEDSASHRDDCPLDIFP